LKKPKLLICTLLLSAALSGCAVNGKCGFGGCAGDAEITANVQASFKQYPALQAPNLVNVETVNHVVYLRGLVDTPYQQQLAASIAGQAAGVTRVVNLIGLSNSR
jgi:osmotically-inducible protein OsmY